MTSNHLFSRILEARLTRRPPNIRLRTTRTTLADVPVPLEGNTAPTNRQMDAKEVEVRMSTSQKYVKYSISSATPERRQKGSAKASGGKILIMRRSLSAYAM
tara:strand:+ start:76 stop:381 length:306 start_codon:yes stop_codon:yes gene_type:complete